MTMAVASTVAAGAYTITVKGTSGTTTESTTVALTVTTAGSGSFTLSVSPTSGYLARGQSGYAVVTVSASGGFDSAVTFTATGVPSGVTYSFSPSSVTGSGTTDFNLTVSRNAPTGTSTITIKGTGGGKTATTKLTFQVRR
jgi:uncharacterized protein YfaS (alpha-2-macroglobulin family)